LEEKKELKRTFQPIDIFKLHKIKNVEEAEKILNSTLCILIYMAIGDSLEFSAARFTKVSNDLIYMENILEPAQVIDQLEKRRLIRIPI